MERITIGKKRFYGDKALQSYVMPEGIVEIGDWAFAGCSNLQKLALPSSIEKIGRNAFLGCEKLERVQLYHGAWKPTKENESRLDASIHEPYVNKAGEKKEGEICDGMHMDGTAEEMMAMTLRYFQGAADVIAAAREGYDAWLAAWDQACHRFLESSDEEGFRPFLAGGEEDYGDEEKERGDYCGKRRLIKARVIVLRLLESRVQCEFYLNHLQKNDKALECIKLTWQQPGDVVSILEEARILTEESVQAVLEELPEEKVEMRALLLQRMAADLNVLTAKLWL